MCLNQLVYHLHNVINGQLCGSVGIQHNGADDVFPLPGTGAWTGAMIAGLMDIRLRSAIPIISVGVLIAGIIVMLVTNAAVLIF